MKTRSILWLTLLSAAAMAAHASPAAAAKIPPLEERAEWFANARFGMFVHWGVYALIGKGEWIQHTGKIPVEEYETWYPKFNPTEFDAAEWVAQAKQAGQKYIVITTKHHDGFCMFDSKLTDYDIMNTPFKRDVIKELTDECHRQGMRIGYYYSIMDWHHPDYLPRRPWEKDRPTEGADFDRYVKYMRGQVREILTNYGHIDVLWFDGGWERKDPEDLKKFQDIIDMARQLQPHLLVNNRAFIGGDFETPEQRVPATGLLNEQGEPMMWEVCMTMTTGHGSFAPTAWWGFDAHETVFKPTDELLHKLIDIVSKGGNFLLNVGPEPTGKIRPEEAERLQGVGRWMQRYGDSIYGTSASPFELLPFFGRVTRKGNVLYVHVFDWPGDRRVVLPGLKTKVLQARVMGTDGDAGKVTTSREGGDVVLHVPVEAPDEIASVLVVELQGLPEVEPVEIEPGDDGSLLLPAGYADIHAKHGQRAKPDSEGGRIFVGNWSNPNDVPTWEFTLPAAGKYRVEVDARPASKEAIGQRVQIAAGEQKLVGKVTQQGLQLDGTLALDEGAQSVSVKLLDAKRTGPPILDLFELKLVPVGK
jgi:alpha-L-fucosidase